MPMNLLELGLHSPLFQEVAQFVDGEIGQFDLIEEQHKQSRAEPGQGGQR